jgi:hypothetical protein
MNIVESLSGLLTPEVIANANKYLGESGLTTQRAFGAALVLHAAPDIDQPRRRSNCRNAVTAWPCRPAQLPSTWGCLMANRALCRCGSRRWADGHRQFHHKADCPRATAGSSMKVRETLLFGRFRWPEDASHADPEANPRCD